MRAERVILETDEEGRLKNPPRLPPLARLEAILLVLDEEPAQSNAPLTRKELRESIRIVGDIMAPAVDPDDWGPELP